MYMKLQNKKSQGTFILRVPSALHVRLKDDARMAGCSLNEYCAQILEAGTTGIRTCGLPMEESFIRDLISHARKVLGDSLMGVVVYGSWARGEAGDSSDVDVMLIGDSGLRITRSLVARWDEQPMTYGQKLVEAHFVALADPAQSVSGLWAELAVDGIVVFERGFRVSRVLSRVRAEIAAGRLQRRSSHGQNYWVHVKDEVA